MTLDDLGPRLCILGPSNSGKLTLADAIARARDLPSVHLDRLHHVPGTDWVARPPDEFARLHETAIAAPRWVMDGNYSQLLPSRLARATGLVLLDVPTGLSLVRYVRRCWFEHDRRGGLDGGRDSVKWGMLRHIAIATRSNRRRYRALFDEMTLPKVRLETPARIASFYRDNAIVR